MRAWIYLLVAIICEVIGTTSIKSVMNNSPVIGHCVMFGMIGVSYFFLALAVKTVPVGVAYALWEGIGIVLITLAGFMWFGEALGFYKICGLSLMVSGIILVKSGVYTQRSETDHASYNEETS